MEFASFKNCGSIPLDSIKNLAFDDFKNALKSLVYEKNCRVSVFTVYEGKLYAVLLDPAEKCFKVVATSVGNKISLAEFEPAFVRRLITVVGKS